MANSERLVCFILGDEFVEGCGYRVAFVKEGESVYRPTGTWPYTGAVGETLPWFWGPTLEDAERLAAERNEAMGISAKDAAIIIARSMRQGLRSASAG